MNWKRRNSALITMRVRSFILSCILLSVSSSSIFARLFYMRATGSDNATGSVSAPWGTLTKANTSMTAGDTLYVRGGGYSGVTGIKWGASGTANDPIVIAAYPGENPVFNGNGASWLLLTNGQYIVIDGLEVTNYTMWAFMPDDSSSYVTIRNCYLHNILAEETAAIVNQQCHNVTIENCVFEEMGRSLDSTLFDHAIYNTAGSHDIIIRNNYFKNNYAGPAINNYHDPSPYNISIYNNVFVMTEGSERAGIYAGDSSHGIGVYNNTFYLNGAGATVCYGISLNSGIGTNVVENNIFYFANWSIQDALEGSSGNSVNYNLYYPVKDSGDKGSRSLAGDPLFKATGTDFHLTALSVARKNALTLSLFNDDFDDTLRPSGAWDIGAFQYSDAAATNRQTGNAPKTSSRSLSIVQLPHDKFMIEWNSSSSPGLRYSLKVVTPQGSLIDIQQGEGNVLVWDNRTHARGVLIFSLDDGQSNSRHLCAQCLVRP